MRKDKPSFLYFIDGTVPTDNDYAAAETIERRDNAHVKFRNGQTPGTGAPELCVKVCGPKVPANYLAKYPFIDVEGHEHAPSAAAAFPVGTEAEANGAEASELSTLAQEVGSVGAWGS